MSTLPVPINWILSVREGATEREPQFVIVKSADEEEPSTYYYTGWPAAAQGMAAHMADAELAGATDGKGKQRLLDEWPWLTLEWRNVEVDDESKATLAASLDSEIEGFSFNALQASASDLDMDAVDYLQDRDLLIEWATYVGYGFTDVQHLRTPAPHEINLQTLFDAPWELVKPTLFPFDADYEFDLPPQPVSAEADNHRLSNYQIVMNAWGHDSDLHDYFLYILPDYPYVPQ